MRWDKFTRAMPSIQAKTEEPRGTIVSRTIFLSLSMVRGTIYGGINKFEGREDSEETLRYWPFPNTWLMT